MEIGLCRLQTLPTPELEDYADFANFLVRISLFNMQSGISSVSRKVRFLHLESEASTFFGVLKRKKSATSQERILASKHGKNKNLLSPRFGLTILVRAAS